MSDFLGFTREEGLEALKKANETSHRIRDGRICICGHPAQAHAELTKDSGRQMLFKAGVNSCRPSKLVCPCQKLVPVLEVSNSRYFIRRTIGSGRNHALSLGLMSAETAKSPVVVLWTTPQTCWRCKTEGASLLPVAVTADGHISIEPEAINALLCNKCIFDLEIQ